VAPNKHRPQAHYSAYLVIRHWSLSLPSSQF